MEVVSYCLSKARFKVKFKAQAKFKVMVNVWVKLVLKVAQNMKMVKSRTLVLMWHLGWHCIWR